MKTEEKVTLFALVLALASTGASFAGAWLVIIPHVNVPMGSLAVQVILTTVMLFALY